MGAYLPLIREVCQFYQWITKPYRAPPIILPGADAEGVTRRIDYVQVSWLRDSKRVLEKRIRKVRRIREESREVASLAQVLRGSFGPHEVVDLPGAGPGGRQTRDTASVAALNLGPEPGDVEGNLRLAEKTIIEAKKARPDLRWLVLPELFVSGYTSLTTAYRYAEDAVRGPSIQRFAVLARTLDLYIAYGFAERIPGSAGPSGIADSANLVGPEGLMLTYRKRHLVRETGEDRVFVPGMELPTVDAGGLRVTLAICWDLGFPEVVREAALEGAELVLAPAGWREPFGTQYELSCAARALDNGVYLASANQLGDYPEARFTTPGHVYGPDGCRISEIAGALGAGEVDLDAPGSWRSRYGSTIHSRGPETEPLEACS